MFKEEGDFTTLKISQLRAQLRIHGLSPVGKKDVLLHRLQSYLQLKAGKPTTHILPDTPANEATVTGKEDEGNNIERATENSYPNHEQPEISPLVYQNLSSSQTTKQEADNVELLSEDPNYKFTQSIDRTKGSPDFVSSTEEYGMGSASGGGNNINDDDFKNSCSNHSIKKHLTENVGTQNKGTYRRKF